MSQFIKPRTKGDAIESRKRMLHNFCRVLKHSIVARQKSIDKALSESPGESVSVPPLSISVSDETAMLLLHGLTATLDSHKDPFGISSPRGNPQRLSYPQRIQAVSDVIDMVSDGVGTVSALERVSDKFGIAYSAMRRDYYDKDIKAFAKLYRDAFKGGQSCSTKSPRKGGKT